MFTIRKYVKSNGSVRFLCPDCAEEDSGAALLGPSEGETICQGCNRNLDDVCPDCGQGYDDCECGATDEALMEAARYEMAQSKRAYLNLCRTSTPAYLAKLEYRRQEGFH